MAEAQRTTAAELVVEVSQARLSTAREAAYQIDAMLDMLNRECKRQGECFDIAMAACMPRLKALMEVVMNVTTQDEGAASIDELREVVYGS